MKIRKSIWLLLIGTLALAGVALFLVDVTPPGSTNQTPSTAPPFDLDIAKAQLEAQVGGTWEKESTNPDVGPMLSTTVLPAPLKVGSFGVIPFPYDKTGKERIDLYLSRCSAPLFVLGHNDHCTVITYIPKTNNVSQNIFKVLRLKETRISEPKH